MTRFLFPMKVMSWDTLQTEDGKKLRPGSGMKAVGYIPVYESIVELVDDHGVDIDSGTFESVEVINDERA